MQFVMNSNQFKLLHLFQLVPGHEVVYAFF